MKQFKKNLILIYVMGSMYMTIEGLWRGWTNISMLFVGGLCAFLIDTLNEYPSFRNKKMWIQCLFGTIITLVIELLSGLVLNVWLGYHIWDYSMDFGNILGQICPLYGLFWFWLMPLCIFTGDFLRYYIFGEEKPNSLLDNYKKLFLNK